MLPAGRIPVARRRTWRLVPSPSRFTCFLDVALAADSWQDLPDAGQIVVHGPGAG